MANDSICRRGHRDGPGQVVSLLHHRTPALPVLQTGNWEFDLGLVGSRRLLSCSHRDELVIWTSWSQLQVIKSSITKLGWVKTGCGVE